ncbi:hypothetical protein PIB30_053499 [Stylosanthes scabra]|uniref:Uncharacterized protein n=1 Tax=Stylosanthes scabra TaxID=79078 RepID=A0ABU6QIG8_9FABA|nr:hypothetical protein [Stylosanthes scabra]
MEPKQILTWNMLTRTSRQIPPPEYFHYSARCHHLFALTYIPQSTTYCIIHAFKLNLDDRVIFYTVYSSATKTWYGYNACEGNLRRLGSEYLSVAGTFSWLNYNGVDNAFSDSLITYSVIDESWRKIGIPAKCKAGPHKLLNFKGKVSIATYPAPYTNQYIIVVRSLIEKRDDQITLTEEPGENGTESRQILLSRIREPKDYLRRHLQCGIWPSDINIQSIAQYCQGLFPGYIKCLMRFREKLGIFST